MRIFAAPLDRELHAVFELASDAELHELSNILYGKRYLSSLIILSLVDSLATVKDIYHLYLLNMLQLVKSNIEVSDKRRWVSRGD